MIKRIFNGNRMNIVYDRIENATNMRVRGCKLMDTCYASRLSGEQTRTERLVWNKTFRFIRTTFTLTLTNSK